MIKANSMMKEYHEIADRLDLDSHDRAVMIDRTDVLMVRLLFGKDVPDHLKTMEQVAGEAVKAMIDKFGDGGGSRKHRITVRQGLSEVPHREIWQNLNIQRRYLRSVQRYNGFQ